MHFEDHRRGAPGTRTRLYRYAQIVSVAVVVLLLAGAMVKSTNTGLSVPDWPLSFGKVMPKMSPSVPYFYEHGHRMIATLVGALTVVLAAWLHVREPRAWMRRLGWVALLMVILQGVLGGMTVLLKLPVWTSAAHACLAQGFFLVVIMIALALSPGWNTKSRSPEAFDSRTPVLATIATATIFVQLVLGAVLRHMEAWQVIQDWPLSNGHLIPPVFTPEIAVHFAHRTWAYVVVIFAIAGGVSALRTAGKRSDIASPAILMLILVVVQTMLGALTIWTHRQPHVASTHLVVGALLLAVSFILTARCWRYLRIPRPLLLETLRTREGAVGYEKGSA
jgi:cytochrome c oxidase assembly protein subunit 15